MSDLDSILKFAALRWLNGVDTREKSQSRGVADRDYWAWKVKDFPNGTLQAGLSGILDIREILDLDDKQITNLCKIIVEGTSNIQRSNGSFEEAYPLESSYAVTGLVAFYLIYISNVHSKFLDEETKILLKTIIDKALAFIKKTPETHGRISNHIATSELAIWLDKGDSAGVDALIDSINPEGWFIEYEGADPGYQSLLLHYFAMANQVRDLPERWLEPLRSASDFCSNFFMNDGSYAGEIGARGTGIFYSSSCYFIGVDKSWFGEAIKGYNQVLPISSDSGNFVPIFNSWCFFRANSGSFLKVNYPMIGSELEVFYPDANLFIKVSSRAKLIVSGVNGSFRKIVKINEELEDQSVSGFSDGDSLSQVTINRMSRKPEEILIQYGLAKYTEPFPNLFTTIILRLLGFTTFWFPYFQRFIKGNLAKFVMRSKEEAPTRLDLTINLADPTFPVTHGAIGEKRLKQLNFGFYSHMASANSLSQRGLKK